MSNGYKIQQNTSSKLKSFIGFIIIYSLVLTTIPYFLFHNTKSYIFITYFANVDIICNILTINFPSYFNEVYDISPDNVRKYISYNIISLIALSGIFIHGISEKNKGDSDLIVFGSMVIMSVITWTLPTQMIPYIVDKIKNDFKITNIDYDVIITTIVSGIFIVLEGILITTYIRYTKNKHDLKLIL